MSEINVTEIDSFLFKIVQRDTGSGAITAPSYKQPNKLSQLQKTQLNLLSDFNALLFKGEYIM